MSYRNPPVVIIGAGVGGLTLALLLRQRGIAAEVLEQSAELREAGAAVGLAANATRVLRFLGLGEDLARVSTEPIRLIHRDGRDGRIVAASRDNRWYREAFGAPFYGLHRMALQRLLAGALGPEHLHLSCRAEALTEPPRPFGRGLGGHGQFRVLPDEGVARVPGDVRVMNDSLVILILIGRARRRGAHGGGQA